jgi:hypothetical protein
LLYSFSFIAFAGARVFVAFQIKGSLSCEWRFIFYLFGLIISPPRTKAAEIIIRFLIMYCPSKVGRKILFD